MPQSRASKRAPSQQRKPRCKSQDTLDNTRAPTEKGMTYRQTHEGYTTKPRNDGKKATKTGRKVRTLHFRSGYGSLLIGYGSCWLALCRACFLGLHHLASRPYVSLVLQVVKFRCWCWYSVRDVQMLAIIRPFATKTVEIGGLTSFSPCNLSWCR
jgi:hypothetical protein